MHKCKTNRFHLIFTLNLISILILSGCWSSKPIEDLNIIVGSALDKDQNGELKSTLQYAIPEAMESKNGMANSQKPYINVAGKGISLEPSGWETTLGREGYIFGSHQKVVLISDELAKEIKLRELTDLYYRDIDLRGSTLIFVAKGKANKVLETEELNVIPSLRIVEIANESLTSEIVRKTSLIKIGALMNSSSSFSLQLLEATNEGVRFTGAAIFKGKTNKMIGTINTQEVEGINWITGEGRGGTVKAFKQKSDGPTFYEIDSMKSKITPKIKGDKISFKVKIESEGRLAEYWNPHLNPEFNEKTIKTIEKNTEKVVKSLTEDVTKRLQTEFKTDIAGFGNQLRIHYPRKWDKLKNNWDEEFTKASIKYDVDITIKDYGMIGKKKNK